MTEAATVSLRSLSRGAWLALGVLFVAGFIHFWVRTTPVRFSNTDDVAFQRLADAGTTTSYMTENALEQARFYFATPFLGPLVTGPYAIRSPRLFSLFRAALLFTQIGLAGWLVARLTQDTTLGLALALGVMTLLHLPLTFFPILSFPPLAIGFISLLAALHFHVSYLREARWWYALGAGFFFLLSCLTQEIFGLFLPLFLGLSLLLRNPRPVRSILILLAVAGAYGLVYVAFARLHPSAYTGTQLSLDPRAALQVLARQMIGLLPGFELVVQRPMAEGFVPLLRPWDQIGRTFSTTPWPDLLLGAINGGALAVLLLRCCRRPVPGQCLWPWFVAFALWINLPLALSAKYQVFLMQRTFPYVYAWYSFFFLVWAGICLLAAWLHLRPADTWRRANSAALFLGCLGLGICSAASNHRVLQVLTQLYN